MPVPLSVLDLAPVGSGGSAARAARDTVQLAQLAERLDYVRYWLAEHHSMPSIASSSPEILIANAAAATERIRVGAGGVMLPNHVPLRVAESYHTLAALHPGRIDLGIGRAPGTDPLTVRALRSFNPEQFPAHLSELRGLSAGTLPDDHPYRGVRVVPGDVELPPIWLLGSSGASAAFAGRLGLGYAFASHFSPTAPEPAIQAYRDAFQPSALFPEPHVILAVSVICAGDDDHAKHLARSIELAWVRIHRGEFLPLPTPDEAAAYDFSPAEQAIVEKQRLLQVVGDPGTVRRRLMGMVKRTGANELMISTMVHDPAERTRSYVLLADAFGLGTDV